MPLGLLLDGEAAEIVAVVGGAGGTASRAEQTGLRASRAPSGLVSLGVAPPAGRPGDHP